MIKYDFSKSSLLFALPRPNVKGSILDGTIKHIGNKHLSSSLTGDESGVTSVCMSCDCKWIIIGCEDYTIRVWNMLRNSQEAVLRGHGNTISSLCISSNGKFIISASWDLTVRIWNMLHKS